MRARFVFSETAIGLRRNLTMTVAVVLTVAIALALLGSGWLMHRQVNAMKDYWFGKIEVSVFLRKDVSATEREQVNTRLQALPDVQRVYYESQQDAHKRFTEQFRNEPDLVRNTEPQALPESFRVKLKDPRNYAVVSAAMQGQPGVDNVADASLLKPFFRVISVTQLVAWSIAALSLLAAGLLVFIMIRVSAYSRRREIGIMRLVGASDFYIQLPFVLEGALTGLFGALIASAGLILIKAWVIDRAVAPVVKFISFIGWDALWWTIPGLVVIGVVLSAVASFLTSLRYLRV